jgi:hypothetical protein
MRILAAASIVLCMAPTMAQVQTPAKKGPGSLTGLWFNVRFVEVRNRLAAEAANRVPRPLPPFQPWALAIHQQHLKDAENGIPYSPLTSTCVPEGMPAMIFPPGQLPIKILETPGEVTMLFEEYNAFRTIYLDVPHEKDPDPTLFGDSVGHWEGDTLVVDTIAIDPVTPIESDVYPHSDAIHVVERIRRTGPGTLENRVLIEDPKALLHPYTRVSELKLVPGTRIQEFQCTNNRNPPDATGHAGVTLKSTP